MEFVYGKISDDRKDELERIADALYEDMPLEYKNCYASFPVLGRYWHSDDEHYLIWRLKHADRENYDIKDKLFLFIYGLEFVYFSVSYTEVEKHESPKFTKANINIHKCTKLEEMEDKNQILAHVKDAISASIRGCSPDREIQYGSFEYGFFYDGEVI